MAQTQAPPISPSRRDTRAEILAVGSELFIEQGYKATSLREIAERLGITKAALYYHFPSKDDILRALMEPVDGIIDELLTRLEAAHNVTEWADALTWLLHTVFEQHMDFFRLLERNRESVAQLHQTYNEASNHHLQMHERVGAAVHKAARDLPEEIRMFAALGAVTAFDDWAPQLLANAPAEVATELEAAVRAILGLPKRRARRGPAA